MSTGCAIDNCTGGPVTSIGEAVGTAGLAALTNGTVAAPGARSGAQILQVQLLEALTKKRSQYQYGLAPQDCTFRTFPCKMVHAMCEDSAIP